MKLPCSRNPSNKQKRKEQQGGKKLISNAPRGGLVGPPTHRPTILGRRLGLQRLRRTSRSQGRRKGGWDARESQRKGKDGDFYRKGTTCQCKGAGIAEGH